MRSSLREPYGGSASATSYAPAGSRSTNGIASRSKIRVRSRSRSAATFAFSECSAAPSLSTKSQEPAPRDIASSPSAPVPANRSSTRAPRRSPAMSFMMRSRSCSAVGRTRPDGETRSRPAHWPPTILTAPAAQRKASRLHERERVQLRAAAAEEAVVEILRIVAADVVVHPRRRDLCRLERLAVRRMPADLRVRRLDQDATHFIAPADVREPVITGTVGHVEVDRFAVMVRRVTAHLLVAHAAAVAGRDGEAVSTRVEHRRPRRPQDHAVDARILVAVIRLCLRRAGHIHALEAAAAEARTFAARTLQRLEIERVFLGETVDRRVRALIDDARGLPHAHVVFLERHDLQLRARPEAAIRHGSAEPGQPDLQLLDVRATHPALDPALAEFHAHLLPLILVSHTVAPQDTREARDRTRGFAQLADFGGDDVYAVRAQ